MMKLKKGAEENIRRLFDDAAANRDFSGAARLASADGALFEYAAGFAHRGFHIPNTVSTRFDTASVTKLFTAAAVLLLEDDGALRLTDRITDILDLSGTAIPKDVELRHLLTHTSGIADDADEEAGEEYSALFVSSPNYALRENADFLKNFVNKPPNFRAGTDVRYNNCAFILLGLAIEKLTGRSYREFVAERVFRPFFMADTGFPAKDDADARVAEGYLRASDGGEPVWKKNIYSFPPVGTADSGAFTTAADLDRFVRAVKASPALEKMMRPQCAFRRPHRKGAHRYGYAFEMIETPRGVFRVYKEGCNDGVRAMLGYYPAADLTFAVMANQDCDFWRLYGEAEELLFENG